MSQTKIATVSSGGGASGSIGGGYREPSFGGVSIGLFARETKPAL